MITLIKQIKRYTFCLHIKQNQSRQHGVRVLPSLNPPPPHILAASQVRHNCLVEPHRQFFFYLFDIHICMCLEIYFTCSSLPLEIPLFDSFDI